MASTSGARKNARNVWENSSEASLPGELSYKTQSDLSISWRYSWQVLTFEVIDKRQYHLPADARRRRFFSFSLCRSKLVFIAEIYVIARRNESECVRRLSRALNGPCNWIAIEQFFIYWFTVNAIYGYDQSDMCAHTSHSARCAASKPLNSINLSAFAINATPTEWL